MIEITLALLIVAIGVLSIVGLVPIGARQHKAALHKNQAAEKAEELLQFLAWGLNHTSNWSTALGRIPLDSPEPWTSAIPLDAGDWNSWADEGQAMFPQLLYLSSHDGFYRIVTQREKTIADVDGVEKTRTVTDSDVVFRVWRTQAEAWGPSGEELISYDDACVLHVEATFNWGADFDDNPIRLYFVLEVRRNE